MSTFDTAVTHAPGECPNRDTTSCCRWHNSGLCDPRCIHYRRGTITLGPPVFHSEEAMIAYYKKKERDGDGDKG